MRQLDPRRTTRELAQDLGVHYATISRYLYQLGKLHKLAQWVPHDFTERDRQRHAEVATQLHSYKRTDSWLKSIIIGEEKWCVTSALGSPRVAHYFSLSIRRIDLRRP
ncbi:unnamed protein product [Heligmosomoides polygyrus]|uniref:HTH domain-containing protein n=1 Tax=Heligmosomoides polygyrus TaxID=6339 RepID=A0A183F9U5_HELPZ|nr:unnamed protein product [Heligmosomoides polygyrus]